MMTYNVYRSKQAEEHCEVEAESAEEAREIACREDLFVEYKAHVIEVFAERS